MLLLAALAVAGCGQPSRLERAEQILDDEDRFTTGLDAGEALADVGALLQEAGVACRERSPDSPRCSALLSASAAAQVMAVRIITCTAPGRFEGRMALLDHVRAVEDDPDRAGPPPAPPFCRPADSS